MTSDGVHLVGQEHLPPILRFFADPSYKYSKHKHTTETSNDGIHHTYTIILSREPLSRPLDLNNLEFPSNDPDDLISQISAPTRSEMVKPSPMTPEMNSLGPTGQEKPICDNQYFMIPVPTVPPSAPPSAITKSNQTITSSSASTSSSTSSNVTSSATSDSTYMSIPDFSHPAILKSTGTGKLVTMVHVKFILLHRDILQRSVQSTFTDEFQSDCRLEDVILNFQQLCARQLRNARLQPRLSYCIGEISGKNSKPVLSSDLGKTLAQLAASNTVFQFALVIDNIDNS
ncbi:unnamed protein product [Caenorhabditis nigoni]